MDPDRSGLTQVPGQVVDSLKNQPVLLVIVVMNLFTIGAILWIGSSNSQLRADVVNKLIERCSPPARQMHLFSPEPMSLTPLRVNN